jgi:hypothetical protein
LEYIVFLFSERFHLHGGRRLSTKNCKTLFDFEQFGFGCFAIFTCSWDFVSAWQFLSLLGPTKTKKVKAINHFFTIQNLSCHRFSGRWKNKKT